MPEPAIDHEARRQITELAVTLSAMRERIDREGKANAAAMEALAERMRAGEIGLSENRTKLATVGIIAASVFAALGGTVVWLIGKAFGGA